MNPAIGRQHIYYEAPYTKQMFSYFRLIVRTTTNVTIRQSLPVSRYCSALDFCRRGAVASRSSWAARFQKRGIFSQPQSSGAAASSLAIYSTAADHVTARIEQTSYRENTQPIWFLVLDPSVGSFPASAVCPALKGLACVSAIHQEFVKSISSFSFPYVSRVCTGITCQ